MKKKINIKYQLLAYILIFSASKVTAQTGILTQNPSQLLHIDGAKDNAATVTPAQAANDVVVTATGNLGVGVLNPVTKVDLRSADQKGIIGLGTNTQAAGVAGADAGAIRYSGAGNIIEYSDGVAWHDLPMTPPPKVLILANKSSAATFNNNQTTQVTNWNLEVSDPYNNFNGSVFTAPRAGFYVVSFNITIAEGSTDIGLNSRIETIIESSTATKNIQTFRSVNSYPGWEATTSNPDARVTNIVGGNCSAVFNLAVGDTIQFKVFHNLGGNRTIDTGNTGTNNSISIYEL